MTNVAQQVRSDATRQDPSTPKGTSARGRPRAPIGRRVLRWRPYAVLLGITGLAVAVRYPTLRQPLIEAHAFRQTQTAFTARIFHQSGIDVLHPQVPVLGEPWSIPFEFPLFQVLATVPMNLGVGVDAAMRLTSLLFFITTAVLVWLVVRHVTRSTVSASAATVFFCFSPFSLLWSRTSLMEFLATAAAVGYAWTAIRWWDCRRRPWAFVAALLGVVAMLVKLTTGLFWVLPIAGWILSDDRGGGLRERVRRALHPGLAGIVGPGLVAGLLWTRHADAVKGGTSTTVWLTSSHLTEWNFGTVAQRSLAQHWITVFDRMEQLLVGRYVCIALVVAALVLTTRRWFWLSIVATALAPILVFFNLYVVHDYYLAAVSPAIAMLLGAGVGDLADRIRSRSFVVPTALGLVALWLVVSLSTTTPYWRAGYKQVDLRKEGNPLPFEIADNSRPTDRVVAVGLDWDPTVFYQADRRGTMLVDEAKTGYPTVTLLEDLRRRGYELFVSPNPAADPIQWSTTWPWVGAVSPHVYRLGERSVDVEGAIAVATSDSGAFDEARAIGRIVGEAIEVPCSSGAEVPAGPGALWLRLAPSAPGVRVTVDAAVAPLPASAVIVHPSVTGSSVRVTCAGAESLLIVTAVVGPPPRSG